MAQELKRFDIVGKYSDEETMYEFRPDGECYDADEVDAVLAEKDSEIARLKDKLQAAEKQTENLINSASSLMLGQDTANDKLDAEIRRLKRALWLAREWRAWCEVQFWFVNPSNTQRDVYHLACTNRIHRTAVEWMAYWQKVESKCRAKAEEYK